MNGLLTKLIKLQTMKLYIRLMYLSHLILDIVVLFSFTDIFRCLIIYSHVSVTNPAYVFLILGLLVARLVWRYVSK